MLDIKLFYRTFYLLLLFPLSLLANFKYDLSICTIFQNDDRFLKEWIEYHRSVGVEHFWLYNNNSTDNFKKVLNPYIKKGIVELMDWPSVQEENDFIHFCYVVQPSAFNDALNRARGITKWIAFIDSDEFIVPISSKSIVKVLEKYFSNFAGVCINWQCYGTSHVKKITKDEFMIEKLVYKLPTHHEKNLIYKSIVQPNYVINFDNPHFANFTPNYYQVNTNGELIKCPNNGVYIDKLRINHYWARDEYFLNNVKVPRYEKFGGKKEIILQWAEEMNQEYDDCILRFVKKMKN